MIRWILISIFTMFTILSCQYGLSSKKVILNDIEMLYGPTTIEQIYYDFPAWKKIEQDFQPDTQIIEKLSELAGNYEVKIFLATWCSDSRREVPHFFKIIKESGLSDKIKVNLWAVDRKLGLQGTLIKDHNISKVATFIFYKENREIGRVVESPDALTLEQDIFSIMSEMND